MYILGINAYHADASACLIKDGEIIAAAEEERFSRVKHCAGFPEEAIKFCLKEASIDTNDLSCIAVSKKPTAHLINKVLYGLLNFHRAGQIKFGKSRFDNYMKLKNISFLLKKLNGNTSLPPFCYVEHHLAHAASTFFASSYEESAVLTIDGFGDFLSTMLAIGKGLKISTIEHVQFPHSLGILYTATSQYLGFDKFGDEGKIMALAGFGKPKYIEIFRDIVRKNGLFELNLNYFTHHKIGINESWIKEPAYGRLWSEYYEKRFGEPRNPEAKVEEKHADIAASLQMCLEETVIKLLNKLYSTTKSPNLCLAGGVALNCVMNGKILENTPFKNVFIQPASSDSGTSLGSALYAYHNNFNKPRKSLLEHVYYGPSFNSSYIEQVLQKYNLNFEKPADLIDRIASYLANGAIMGWFSGKMEFGPRALGNRSILADPRNPKIKDQLNSRVKYRDSFRPFAASIIKEAVEEYFYKNIPSPFMLVNYRVRENKANLIPAVLHTDGSSRIQIVAKEANPKFWQLLKAFENKTGIPILLNTSFNENEPIVCTPEDAIECFLRTKMDYLILEEFLVPK